MRARRNRQELRLDTGLVFRDEPVRGETWTLGLDIEDTGYYATRLNLGVLGFPVEHGWGAAVSDGRQLGVSEEECSHWYKQYPGPCPTCIIWEIPKLVALRVDRGGLVG